MAEPAPREYPITRHSEYRDALLDSLGQARSSLRWLDLALDDPAYDSPAFIAPLRTLLLHPAANARILLHQASHVAACAPRLLDLVAHFPGKLSIRILSSRHQAYESVFLAADGQRLAVRFTHTLARGKYCVDDPQTTHAYAAQFDTMWEEATQGPNGAPLGL